MSDNNYYDNSWRYRWPDNKMVFNRDEKKDETQAEIINNLKIFKLNKINSEMILVKQRKE